MELTHTLRSRALYLANAWAATLELPHINSGMLSPPGILWNLGSVAMGLGFQEQFNHLPRACIILTFCVAPQEAEAARSISQRGVMLVATAHGTDLRSIMGNPDLNSLVGGMQVGVHFQEDMGTKMINPCQKVTILSNARTFCILPMPQTVILGDAAAGAAHGGAKTRTERRGEPTFRCLRPFFVPDPTAFICRAVLCALRAVRCGAVFGTCTSAFMLAERDGTARSGGRTADRVETQLLTLLCFASRLGPPRAIQVPRGGARPRNVSLPGVRHSRNKIGWVDGLTCGDGHACPLAYAA